MRLVLPFSLKSPALCCAPVASLGNQTTVRMIAERKGGLIGTNISIKV